MTIRAFAGIPDKRTLETFTIKSFPFFKGHSRFCHKTLRDKDSDCRHIYKNNTSGFLKSFPEKFT